jgi:hypothetical protein
MATTIIDAMEASDTSGTLTINDPNNGFVMQLFANLCVFSKFSEKVDYTTGFYYSKRSRDAKQLYSHLSEFDYVNLMAKPATLPFAFAVTRDWIITNSVYFDSNYNKIQIPAYSYVTMGGITYSMYYPIDILVNRNTGAISAFYNTDSATSLYTLESNMLLDVQEYTRNGLDWYQIQFNMFQFVRDITTYPVGSSQGFIKTLSYEDQFYALKVYQLNSDAVTWSEIPVTMDKMYYDYQTPTVLISLLTDNNQIKVEIPQIYFDNNQLSKTIKLELYTTKGNVNYSVSAADAKNIKANFITSNSAYSAPLEQIPSYVLLPTTTEVSGGSDAMTYSEIRNAIVNREIYDKVAVTPLEIKEAGLKAGFNLYRVVDDLIDRIYYATNVLSDSNSIIIPTFTGSILLAGDNLNQNPSTIYSFTDGYYTVLPTTTFKIPNSGTTCVPLTNGEVATMAAMSKADLVTELNKGIYVRQPFHITLLTTPKSPVANIYNLLSPSMNSLSFILENSHSAPQMSATAGSISHQNNGTGGYLINLQITRSSNITDTDATNFRVLLTCRDKLGRLVYFPLSFISTSSGDDIWQMVLATSYHITNDNYLSVMMYNDDDVLTEVEISLSQTFNILTMFVTSFDNTIPKDNTLNSLLPSSFSNTYTVMAQQNVVFTLGTNLSSMIYSAVNTTWGSDTYKTADTTIYYTTNVPIYQTNETGVMEARYNSTTHAVEVAILYNMGDTPASTDDISFKTTSDTVVPSSGTTTTFSIDDPTGILIGMTLRGTNIPVSSKVVNKTTNSVTIDSLITTNIPSGTVLTCGNPNVKIRTNTVQSSLGKILAVPSTTNMLVGQSVVGLNIPTGAVIESIDSSTQIRISIPTTTLVANNTLLTIINKTAHGVVKVAQGEIERDPAGNPIVLVSAKNQYRIPSILFDGRLFASEDTGDVSVISAIYQRLQNYANQIKTIDSGLLEDSDVYYKPVRTMGYATFGIGDSKTQSIPLELSFVVDVYVSLSVYNNSKLKTTMESSIYSVINTQIQVSPISISDLGNAIKATLGSNVNDVEMKGINGDDNLKLIALEQYESSPCVEHKLVLNPDNSISRVPNITINWKISPSTLV